MSECWQSADTPDASFGLSGCVGQEAGLCDKSRRQPILHRPNNDTDSQPALTDVLVSTSPPSGSAEPVGERMDDRGAAAPYSVRGGRQPAALEVSSARCRGHLNIAQIMRRTAGARTVAPPAPNGWRWMIGASGAVRLRIMPSALCFGGRFSTISVSGSADLLRLFRRRLVRGLSPLDLTNKLV